MACSLPGSFLTSQLMFDFRNLSLSKMALLISNVTEYRATGTREAKK